MYSVHGSNTITHHGMQMTAGLTRHLTPSANPQSLGASTLNWRALAFAVWMKLSRCLWAKSRAFLNAVAPPVIDSMLVKGRLRSFGMSESPAMIEITLRITVPSEVLFFRRKLLNFDSVNCDSESEGLLVAKTRRCSLRLSGVGVARSSGKSYNGGYILWSIMCCSKLLSYADDGLVFEILVAFVDFADLVRWLEDAERREGMVSAALLSSGHYKTGSQHLFHVPSHYIARIHTPRRWRRFGPPCLENRARSEV